MKILDLDQRSIEWVKARFGRVTASELDNLLTPAFKQRDGEMPKTYLCKKLAEAFRGEPLPGFGSYATEQGSLLEEEALPWFNLQYDVDVKRVGFIVSDDGKSGCSPDGLLENEGVEIKSPERHTHVKYLLNGDEVPKDYLAQVHMSMFVTGFPQWTFVSYCRRFPAVVVKVQRDEKICAQIKAAVDSFHETFNAAMAKLKSFV